jgi:PqqD family protein of HPr-rel-A system
MSALFVRNQSIEAAPLQQELMLFSAATKKFCVLNPSAAHIWARLEQPRTEDELVASLCEQFNAANREAVEQDVRGVLGLLESLDLVSKA